MRRRAFCSCNLRMLEEKRDELLVIVSSMEGDEDEENVWLCMFTLGLLFLLLEYMLGVKRDDAEATDLVNPPSNVDEEEKPLSRLR
mmetsp:Transcript_24282/g.39652  ORF Transcript_24282/g.39652 Transcript_24282/m.39652 type:complete len:86 (+) Transcript_24282:746-1003(+)